VSLYPRKRVLCIHRIFVCWFICLSVSTITKKSLTDFNEIFRRCFCGHKDIQVQIWLRSLAGSRSYCRKKSESPYKKFHTTYTYLSIIQQQRAEVGVVYCLRWPVIDRRLAPGGHGCCYDRYHEMQSPP